MSFWAAYKYVICWALMILILCGMNGAYIPHFTFTEFFSVDKVAHMMLFGILSYLMVRARRKWKAYHRMQLEVLLPTFLVAFSYGALIEVLQATVFINRSFDYADMTANGLGCLIAWVYLTMSFRNRINIH